jgi:hypothetical protein
MPGTLKVGGNIIASHTGVEGAGTVTLGNVVLGDSAVPTNNYTFRNKIINGGMRIDQRNAGGAVTTANSYPVDRFSCLHITDGAFSAQQDSSAPSGFTNSIKWTTTTADTSFAATQHALVRQRIEGNNIYDLEFGTASAKTITLSFWVKSSLTGTFGGSLMNNGQTRCYPYSYTISTADTWEHKSITIPGDTDTSITWLTTNGVGLEVFWSMGVGSDYDGTAGAWTSTPYQYSVTGAVSVMGTLNANWYLTGVQLEIGSSATPFEHRPIGVELKLCKRYYATGRFSGLLGYAGGRQSAFTDVNFEVEMRATPTSYVSYNGTAGTLRNNNTGGTGTGWTTVEGTNKYIAARNNNASVADNNIHYSTTYFADAEL